MIIIKRSSANSRAGIGWGSLLIVHHSPRTGGKRTAMRERCLYMTAEIPARHVAVGEGARYPLMGNARNHESCVPTYRAVARCGFRFPDGEECVDIYKIGPPILCSFPIDFELDMHKIELE